LGVLKVGASLLAALLCLQSCQPATSTQSQNTSPKVTATASPVQGGKTTAESPKSTAPAGATARCRDGTYSYSQNHRGTCSHHGGVAQWL